jgi:hypothetical protein
VETAEKIQRRKMKSSCFVFATDFASGNFASGLAIPCYLCALVPKRAVTETGRATNN